MKSGKLWHGALVSTRSPPAGCSSEASVPLDGRALAKSLQVPPGQCLAFMLPARPLRKSELVTLSQSYSCAGIYIPTSKLHINLKAKQSSLIFQHQRTERRGDLPETTTLIAAHLESGPRPPWLQGPCAFCSATLPSTGPLTHISVSPHTEVELFMPSGLEDFIRIC